METVVFIQVFGIGQQPITTNFRWQVSKTWLQWKMCGWSVICAVPLLKQ